jgi:hypothetical protein
MSQTQTDSCQDEGDGRGGGEGSGRPNGRQPETQPVLRIRDVYPGSRTDPDFYPSRIPDPGSRISDPGSRIPDPKPGRKERGKKNLLPTVYTFLLKLTPPPLYGDIVKFLLSSTGQVRTGNRGKYVNSLVGTPRVTPPPPHRLLESGIWMPDAGGGGGPLTLYCTLTCTCKCGGKLGNHPLQIENGAI